jgi:hypothetical protein
MRDYNASYYHVAPGTALTEKGMQAFCPQRRPPGTSRSRYIHAGPLPHHHPAGDDSRRGHRHDADAPRRGPHWRAHCPDRKGS